MKLVACLVLGTFASCGSNPPVAGLPAADLGSVAVWVWCDDEGPGGSGPGPQDGFERLTDAGVRQVKVDVANDPFYCGGCGVFCWDALGVAGADADERIRNQATVDAQCVGGTCVFQCRAGRDNCDGNRGNGCEMDTASDPNHCGACNKACPPGNQNWIWLCQNSSCHRIGR